MKINLIKINNKKKILKTNKNKQTITNKKKCHLNWCKVNNYNKLIKYKTKLNHSNLILKKNKFMIMNFNY
jgi:hypothetical protein